MRETSHSLLLRLADAPNERDWERLVAVYQPWLGDWFRRQAASAADADDLTQEVLAVVVRRLPEFRHNGRPGAFRAWLRLIATHTLRAFWRRRPPTPGSQEKLDSLEDPGSVMSQQWDREHDLHVIRRLMDLIAQEFEPNTWEAFRRVVQLEEPPAAVAAALGITVNAVFIAKSRVMKRLRQEASGLVIDGGW